MLHRFGAILTMGPALTYGIQWHISHDTIGPSIYAEVATYRTAHGENESILPVYRRLLFGTSLQHS